MTSADPQPRLLAALSAALHEWGVTIDGDLASDTSLIRSGLLDSVALFNLSLWIEEQVGRPIDPAAVNPLQRWDTPAAILEFIASWRGATTDPPPVAAAEPPSMRRAAATAPPGLQLRIADERDDGALASLYTRLWSPDPAANRAFLAWKYRQNPSAGEALIHIVYDTNGKFVAARGFCPSVWEATAPDSPARMRMTWYAVDDLVISPAYESQGVFAWLVDVGRAEMRARRMALYLSLSALRITRLQSLTTGSIALGSLRPIGVRRAHGDRTETIDRLLRQLPLAWRLSPAWRRRAGARAFARLDAASALSTRWGEVTVVRTPDAAAMADLIARLPYDGRIRQVRDADYFAWRYRNPLHEHRVLLLRDGGVLRGYLAIERALSDFGNGLRLNVFDWEADTEAVAEALLQFALNAADPPELVLWSASLTAARAALLTQHRFNPIDVDHVQRGLPTIMLRAVDDTCRFNDAAPRPMTDLQQWDIRMCYTNAV